MISKLRFSLITVIMLVLVGFGFQNQAQGQVGLNGLFCPAVPDTTGWLMTERVGVGLVAPDFSAGLIGTVEDSGFDAVGGLDWQQVDVPSFNIYEPSDTPTNEAGSQLVSWWTQKDGRNTYLQVTNANGGPVTVHVRIHNEACAEIRDFCDDYTGYDTHEYNLGDLFANDGADIADGNLQGVEGWLVVTAVKDCGSPLELPRDYDYLTGQLIVHDSDDYLYGVNTYARQAVCFGGTVPVEVNRVQNGSYQNGEADWDEELMFAQVTTGFAIDPGQIPPPNPYGSPNMAFVISNAQGGFSSGVQYDGGSFSNIPNINFANVANIALAADANVAIWESDPVIIGPNDTNTLTYNIQNYFPNPGAGGSTCENYTAVLLIQDNGGGNGTLIDGLCYQELGVGAQGGNGNILGTSCFEFADSDDDVSFLAFEFDGRTGFQLGETLMGNGPGTYRIQVIAAQSNFFGGCTNAAHEVGGLVNNFQWIGTNLVPFDCDGCLDGSFNAHLDRIDPDVLYGQFNILPANLEAGADVVLINFADDYGNGPGSIGSGPYRPVAATTNYFISIFDEFEVDQSCGDLEVCFVRYGIDDALVLSENFNPATPTPTPTPTPTATPTATPTPTPTPSPTGGGGGGGSCAIAGSPVQLGTALANVLIPLVPVAFAFGVRAVRRRKK